MARVRVLRRVLDEIAAQTADAADIDPSSFGYGYAEVDDAPRVQVDGALTLSQLLVVAAGLARVVEIQQQDQPQEKTP
jgi:hypothetical protein